MPNPPKPKIVSRKHLARLERERIQRRYLLIGAAIVAFLVVGSIVYGILDANVFQYNQAVAKVGDQTITVRDFQTAVRFQRYQLINQYNQYYQFYSQFQGDPFGIRSQLDQVSSTLTQTTLMGGNVLDRMIQEIVIAKEAAKRGITVTDAEVDKEYQSVFGYFPNGTPTTTLTLTAVITSTLNPTELAIVTITPTPTTAPTSTTGPTNTPLPATATPTVNGPTSTVELSSPTAAITQTPTITDTPTITPTSTPFTAEGFKTVVSNFMVNMTPLNISETDIRKFLYNQIMRTKLSDAIGNEVAPTQDEVWARHIVVADEASANTILTRLKNGEDFAKVAAEVSIDTNTKNTGGDLGWFAKGVQDPAVETAAFSMQIGDLSQPIKSVAGYEIIQVIAHEVRALSANDLSTARTNAFDTWLNKQTSDPSIVKYDIWSQKVPTDPTFTPPNLPPVATQPVPVLPTDSTLPVPANTPVPIQATPTP